MNECVWVRARYLLLLLVRLSLQEEVTKMDSPVHAKHCANDDVTDGPVDEAQTRYAGNESMGTTLVGSETVTTASNTTHKR